VDMFSCHAASSRWPISAPKASAACSRTAMSVWPSSSMRTSLELDTTGGESLLPARLSTESIDRSIASRTPPSLDLVPLISSFISGSMRGFSGMSLCSAVTA